MATQTEIELWAIIQEQRKEIDELKGTINRWKFNGTEDLFGGGGFQRYGGALMRIDNSGIQIESDDDTASSGVGLRAIKWVPKFIPPTEDPDDVLTASPDGQYSQLTGNADNTDNWIQMEATRADVANHHARVLAYAEGGTARASLRARRNSGGAESEVTLDGESDAVAGHLRLATTVLELDNVTSDPSGFVRDGGMWYRSDTDEIRVRINGATRVLSHTAP